MSIEDKSSAPEEILATEIKSIKDEVSKEVQGVREEIKSFQDFQAAKDSMESKMEAQIKSLKEELESKSAEEKKSLEAEIEALKSKQKKSVSGVTGNGETQSLEEKKNMISEKIVEGLKKEGKSLINHKEVKSFVSFDNTGAGYFATQPRILNEINVNQLTKSFLSDVVNKVTAPNIQLAKIPTFDMSYIDVAEKVEGAGAPDSDIVKRGEIEINATKYSAKVAVSDVVFDAERQGGFTVNPINSQFEYIVTRHEKNISRDILNGQINNNKGIKGILPQAKESGSRINVVPSSSGVLAQWSDLVALPKSLKGQYVNPSAYFVVDRAFYYYLYTLAADDGHILSEFFDYGNDGIVRIKTAEGSFRVVTIESSADPSKISENDGFADYESFLNTTTIDSGFNSSGDVVGNQGKALALFINPSQSFTLLRSPAVDFVRNPDNQRLLVDGYSYIGLRDYVGGRVTLEESIAILYQNS
jgi:HK97 family phage major capsid protein